MACEGAGCDPEGASEPLRDLNMADGMIKSVLSKVILEGLRLEEGNKSSTV